MPNKKTLAYKNLPWLALSLAIILIDQLSKYWIATTLTFAQRRPVFPYFDLTLRYNTGAAFSFLAQAGKWAPWFLGGLALIASFIIVFTLLRLPSKKYWLAAALALILGGALGNLIDRITHGFVVDFLLFYVNQWQWPAFNVADSAICIGAGMLVIAALRKQL